MKFLFASWGNPAIWGKVRYEYKDKSTESPDPIELIKSVENPDYTVILSLDTLADNEKGKIFSDYDEILDTAKCEIVRFLNRNSILADEIIVLPGTGTFRNGMEFEGNADDIYYVALYELGKLILGKLPEPIDENGDRDKVEIILDITHGINFQTTIIYKVLFEIAQVLAYFYEVEFSVLNSDPYYRGIEKPLKIHEIERIKVVPHVVFYRYENPKILQPADFLDGSEKGDIGKKITERLEDIKDALSSDILYFASAFMYALPLWVIYFMADLGNLKEAMQEIFRIYKDFIEVSVRKVRRKAKIMSHTANVVKVWIVAELLKRMGFSQKPEDITIDEIKDLKPKVYDKFPIESNRIDREIADIESTQNMPNSYQVFAQIKKGQVGNQVDKRNFFAHAGFEYNSFEIKMQGNKIYLKPNEGQKPNNTNTFLYDVKKLLKDNLPKGG